MKRVVMITCYDVDEDDIAVGDQVGRQYEFEFNAGGLMRQEFIEAKLTSGVINLARLMAVAPLGKLNG